MVSSEFKEAVSAKNLLRVRIMIKDSFVVDPTLVQMDEMLWYAKKNLPNLLVSYNGDVLENDHTKWTFETMNEELVQLVTNFSDIRINHLKEVVTKVMADEIEKIRANSTQTGSAANQDSIADLDAASSGLKKVKKVKKVVRGEARHINKVLDEVEKNRVWRPSDIKEIERAAKEILKVVRDYKKNR